ncbi:WG repeat-containing protein [Oscillospiraceae bacterium 44-34]
MRRLKKAVSLALALVMCLGLLTVPTSAAGATLTEIVSEKTYASFLEGFVYAVRGFHEGVTWHGAPPNNSYGAFDAAGQVIVSPGTYYEVRNFSDGVAWAARDKAWYAVDNTGRELFSLDQNLDVVDDGKSDFHDGLAMVYNRETQKYGYVDKTGKVVIPFEHNSSAGAFNDGLAVVYDAANAFYGYMDKTGKVVIPSQYTAAKDFVNGFGVVLEGRRWTVIDTTGKELISQEYEVDGALFCTSEVAWVRHRDNGYAFVNRSGQIVSSGWGENWSARGFSNGMMCVGKDGKYGFVNESGVLVIPCQYDSADKFHDGYSMVRVGTEGAYSIIDKTGRVTGTISKSVRNAGNGCFLTYSNESGRTRYGFIDYTGREIVPCKYKAVGDFSGGVAAVSNFEDKWGFVNTTGAEIVPCQYNEIRYAGETGVFEVEEKVGSEWPTRVLKASGWTEPSISTQPTTPEQPAAPKPVSALPTNDKLTVNGTAQDPTIFKLDGGDNYFKIRDLASMFDGTSKRFSVGYDGSVQVTTGQAYTPVGGELAGAAEGSYIAEPTNDVIYIDGVKADLTAYKIEGNNFFRLRDLGRALDFYVGWAPERGVFIETDKPYSE